MMTQAYAPLHTYLENRYANRVVLTLAEIEDLLGCTLPPAAHVDAGWWGNDDSNLTTRPHSRSWTRARRIAAPNLPAHIVIFERRQG
jgi:hypothetical protein